MKDIKKVTIELSDVLLQKIERAVFEDGFHSRSEFIRFLIQNYAPKSEGGCFRAEPDEEKVEEDEYANVDCTYGIPPEIVAKFAEEARRKAQARENGA
jgi:hypothetical protein